MRGRCSTDALTFSVPESRSAFHFVAWRVAYELCGSRLSVPLRAFRHWLSTLLPDRCVVMSLPVFRDVHDAGIRDTRPLQGIGSRIEKVLEILGPGSRFTWEISSEKQRAMLSGPLVTRETLLRVRMRSYLQQS